MNHQEETIQRTEELPPMKSFLDRAAPAAVRFYPDHYIFGSTYRCAWALRGYPTQTEQQALLRHLGEKSGVTLRIYTRQVTPGEERQIIQAAANRHRLERSSTHDLRQSVTAQADLQDVADMVATLHRSREPLLHCAVYLELTAPDMEGLFYLLIEAGTSIAPMEISRTSFPILWASRKVSAVPPAFRPSYTAMIRFDCSTKKRFRLAYTPG